MYGVYGMNIESMEFSEVFWLSGIYLMFPMLAKLCSSIPYVFDTYGNTISM